MVEGVTPSGVTSEVAISNLSEFANVVNDTLPPKWIFRGQPRLDPLLPGVQRRGVRPGGIDPVFFERELLERFQRQARPHLSSVPSDVWEWLALAQHHGLPTRLLDWTQNAAAALYFAVETPNDGSDSGVWAYNHTGMYFIPSDSPFEISNVVVYDPPHIAARFTSQRGCFTAHPTDFPDRTEKWLGDIFMIRIPVDARVGIRRNLRVIGVDRASLFPDPDGVASAIRRVMSPPRDERL